MVFLKQYLFKIILAVFIIVFLVVSPFSLFSKIYELNYTLNSQLNLQYFGVLELWNVDTFEGGSVSRVTFLEKRAIEFERKNKGVYISVSNVSVEQLKLNLENGKKPDIITFGIGVGELIEKELISLDDFDNVRSDLLKSGEVNGMLKAVPIILGGYSLIQNTELSFEEISDNVSNVVYSTKEGITPVLSLFVNDIKVSTLNKENLTSFDAYDKFVNNKFDFLLGTQRDYYRCKNRESNFKMQCNYKILGGFTDLIVYGGVFNSNPQEESLAQSFLSFLTTEEVQNKIANINMFPVINKNIYEDENYKTYNNILLNKLKTLNVFYSNDKLKELKTKLNEYYCGKNELKNQILKYLI